MSGVDPAGQRDEAKAWVAKAEEDLGAVRACLDAERPLLALPPITASRRPRS
jgi:hypothetical protein